jgi:hypothetical protein
MLYDSIRNEGEYFTNYYLADRLPDEVKRTLGKAWAKLEQDRKPSPRTRLNEAASAYPAARRRVIDTEDPVLRRKHLTQWHLELLRHLGYEDAAERVIEVKKAGEVYEVPVLFEGGGVVAIECGFAETVDEARDAEGAGRLAVSFDAGRGKTLHTGSDLASWLFTADGTPPSKVLMLCGGSLIFADRNRNHWGTGKFLGIALDAAFARADVRGELEVIAALISAEVLLPDDSGEAAPLDRLVEKGLREAEGVSERLRDGLRRSVELIAGEVVKRLDEQGVDLADIGDDREVAARLVKESLRYLYRILFLLYAEARPELGILPVENEEYIAGYSMARLGERVVNPLDRTEEDGFHFYESLDLLFRLVNQGHRYTEAIDEDTSEGRGLRFEPLRATLFEPESIELIGKPAKLFDGYEGEADTRLRNKVLHQVVRWLMIDDGEIGKPGRRTKRKQAQFVSYAKLGIPQLGAVYEGLMSYTGKIARGETYYEVADPADIKKHGHPKKGSWLVPESEAHRYDEDVFVKEEDPHTGQLHKVEYPPGSFVYRLAGRERQTSASYYTPKSLAEVTVQLTLDQREKEAEQPPTANEMLHWKILEPALGSGNFLNVVLDQLAERYLKKREEELKQEVKPELRQEELRKIKAYIALHNCYGVDLNSTAVELAEVSMWLNVMHRGMQSPWFGLHLREGNSLIGARREVYDVGLLRKKAKSERWLNVPPTPKHLRDGAIGEKDIHHFLLPAEDWGAVAKVKEVRDLAPEDAKKLKDWRAKITAKPSEKQIDRLLKIAGRVEFLWELVRRRLEASEREIARDIEVWGLEHRDLPPDNALPKEEVKRRLEVPGGPYWRLKSLMDAWCALWFWPVTDADLLDGTNAEAYKPDLVTSRSPRALNNLDDWITFAEFMVGGSSLPNDALITTPLETIPQIDEFENELAAWMGMGDWVNLANRFGWYKRAEEIAKEQKFFHWELHYAHVFHEGGFDIQVGNPPWVRPIWDEDMVMAELDPQFVLGGWSTAKKREQKADRLATAEGRNFLLAEHAIHEGVDAYCGSSVIYAMLKGTQPDLYRCFMSRVWANFHDCGAAGLIHPDTHFAGSREGEFRGLVYSFLRLHVNFVNERKIFPDLTHNQEFGMHVYGSSQPVDFLHFSAIFEPEVVVKSLIHDGSGEVPGIKFQGTWDIRPHASRCIHIDRSILRTWHKLTGETEIPYSQSRLLSPINSVELSVIASLAGTALRFGDLNVQISPGFHEKNSKTNGLIEAVDNAPHIKDKLVAKTASAWSEVVLQAPHLGVASAFSKNPRTPCNSHLDWDVVELAAIPETAVPLTNYVQARACESARFVASQQRWVDYSLLNDLLSSPVAITGARDRVCLLTGKRSEQVTDQEIRNFLTKEAEQPYSNFYRLAWRMLTPMNSERSLYPAIIPPAVSHIDGIYSAGFTDSPRELVFQSGLWASLLSDYFIRVVGIRNLKAGIAQTFPTAPSNHSLADQLMLRMLRLSCLTDAYAPLWEKLYDPSWVAQDWAVRWPGLSALGDVSPKWSFNTPLRTAFSRRAALVEIDVIAAMMLGVSPEQLSAIFRSRYPVIGNREHQTWFDADGRKICGDPMADGYRLVKESFQQLMAHLEHGADAPEGYRPFEHGPTFYRADRVREYDEAFRYFDTFIDHQGD